MEPTDAPQLTTAIASSFTGIFVMSQATKVWLLIAVRFILVSMMAIGGMIAVISTYNWINSEGNEVKAHENKQRLGNALIMITIFFVLMAVYHYFIPDYSVLAL